MTHPTASEVLALADLIDPAADSEDYGPHFEENLEKAAATLRSYASLLEQRQSARNAGLEEAAQIAFNHGCANEGCRDCVGGNLAAIYREMAKRERATPPATDKRQAAWGAMKAAIYDLTSGMVTLGIAGKLPGPHARAVAAFNLALAAEAEKDQN